MAPGTPQAPQPVLPDVNDPVASRRTWRPPRDHQSGATHEPNWLTPPRLRSGPAPAGTSSSCTEMRGSAEPSAEAQTCAVR
jgi:hypothetical protein